MVVGAGGFAREVLDTLQDVDGADPDGAFEVVAVVADPEPDPWFFEPYGLGAARLGSRELLDALPGAAYVVAIGAPDVRERIDSELRESRPSPVVVHPRATVARRAVELGPGSLLLAFCTVGPRVVIGRHVHISAHVDLGEGTRVGDHVTFSPNVCVGAGVVIEAGVFFGTSAVVGPGVCIGAGAVIGSGAVVDRDVPAGCTAVGRPLRLV